MNQLKPVPNHDVREQLIDKIQEKLSEMDYEESMEIMGLSFYELIDAAIESKLRGMDIPGLLELL
jgi:hypothetical protein